MQKRRGKSLKIPSETLLLRTPPVIYCWRSASNAAKPQPPQDEMQLPAGRSVFWAERISAGRENQGKEILESAFRNKTRFLRLRIGSRGKRDAGTDGRTDGANTTPYLLLSRFQPQSSARESDVAFPRLNGCLVSSFAWSRGAPKKVHHLDDRSRVRAQKPPTTDNEHPAGLDVTNS
ncbi:hypothetical protein ACLOJK_020314 [Asimina triloba]